MIENSKKILKCLMNIFKIFIYIFLIIIIVINFIIIVKKVKNPNEIPSIFEYRSFVIKSGSMDPNVKIGDMVIVKKVSKDDLNIGDIITYISGDSIITHRIIEVNQEELRYITRGDNNNTNDKVEPKYEDVLGKVVLCIPKVGGIILFLQNKTIYIIFIVVAAFMLYLKSSKKNYEDEYKKIKENLK